MSHPTRLYTHKVFLFALLFSALHATTGRASDYALSTVDKKPVPRSVLFQLWHEIALKQCDHAEERNNTSPQNCREIIAKRGPKCETAMIGNTPEIINKKSQSRQIGRKYLQCALPYYFCNGIEVRTEEEARKTCR